jgi:pimeloyl-ACP methyl ester carboxylesterase
MTRWITAAAAALFLVASAAQAVQLPWAGGHAALVTDPPHDAAHPARSEVLHIPTGGVEVNGLAYIPVGAGPHPVVLLLHGLPGNEKNLDLAQAMRRNGWIVVTMNYRGSWGSPGSFNFMGNLDDAKAALAYIRSPEVSARLGVDSKHIVVIGHSMGGWVAAVTAANDPAVEGAVLISGADMSLTAKMPADARLKLARDNMETLATTDEDMAQQMASLGDNVSFATAAPKLAGRKLLIMTANDGLAPQDDALAAEVKAAGGKMVTVFHADTDHSWSDERITLEREVLTWLDAKVKAPNAEVAKHLQRPQPVWGKCQRC